MEVTLDYKNSDILITLNIKEIEYGLFDDNIFEGNKIGNFLAEVSHIEQQ